MAANQISDIVGLLGILISVLGFIATIIKLRTAQRTAEAARDAAEKARQSIAYAGVLADFAAGAAILEEIERFHRNRVFVALPDRYTALRKILVIARAGSDGLQNGGLTEKQKVVIQAALANIASAQGLIDRAIANNAQVDFPRLNRIFAKDLDALHEVLVHLKSLSGGQV
ncbi:hypothetical protein [uncultured Reyranella sp.]|uniref:hypothetical protein n=1 Tax=uncultured Reyranella sp. TaxID=735512 RepID=UPI0025D95C03|nr:hypothetical protein [uncultured Reyranella sp.]